ncbi:MAG: DNA processing protein DprA, partial [Acidimicrobiia bacterium]|nr:DNA processing protein DprA [Acidimicrobiia bacterium]
EHGKRLFLVAQLVASEDWAKRYAECSGATVVKSVDDIVTVLAAEQTAQQADQLSLL